MHIKTLTALALATTLGLAGLGACAVDRGPDNLTPQRYVDRAVSSDSFEILSSQMALQNAQDPQVRNFAQQMITEHTATTQLLAAAVKTNEQGLAMPAPGLMLPEERAMVAQLQSSPSFDRDYIAAQIAAHDKAIAVNQQYIQYGDNDALLTNAKTVLPHITQHRQMIEQIASQPRQ